MRKIALILVLILTYSFAWSAGVEKDTVEVEFGNNSKIIIQTENKEDLEKIKQYDLNKMIQDVQESANGDTAEIEDEDGTKYLKDAAEDEDDDFQNLQSEFDERSWEDDEDDEEDYDYDYKYSSDENSYSYRGTIYGSAIDFGINQYQENGNGVDNAEPYYVRPWGSWHVALKSHFQSRVAGRFAIEWGPSVAWYNFKYEDPTVLMSRGPESVEFDTQTLEFANANKSKLTVASINLTMVPLFDFGYKKETKTNSEGVVVKRYKHHDRGFRIGAGGYVGYRIDSYSKNVTLRNGRKNKVREFSKFYLNDLRYGLRGIIGYGPIDFFVQYDLSKLYDENRGPDLNAFSFGITL